MEFETIDDDTDLGAPVRDVVQEAIDATATRYTGAPELDVDQALREELRSRGVRATTAARSKRSPTRSAPGTRPPWASTTGPSSDEDP